MSKFKVGDKVRCVGEYKGSSAGWVRGKVFRVARCVEYRNSEIVYFPEEGCGVWEKQLELVQKTWDTLEVGDIIVGVCGECKVLFVSGEVVIKTYGTKGESYGCATTTKGELKKDGYTIKNSTPVVIPELTMSEVIEKIGYPIKIKE